MSRSTFTVTFPAFPGHICRPVSALSPEENQALMAEVNGIYRTIFAAVEAHTEANPGTRQLAYIMAAHAVKLALEGEDDNEITPEEPEILTEGELAEVAKVFDPLIDVLDAYVEANPQTWDFAAMHEALARADGYLDDMQRAIDLDIAAEEADA